MKGFAVLSLCASARAATEQVGADGGGLETSYMKLTKAAPQAGTCGGMKDAYKEHGCCGNPSKVTNQQLVPMNPHKSQTANPCDGQKNMFDWENKPCFIDDALNAMEQAGANVTLGYVGGLDSTSSGPIETNYFKAGLCPVNVHWHLGTEHYSVGEYDEHGEGPDFDVYTDHGAADRRLADKAKLGFRCHHYDAHDARFTTDYTWHHCADMHVGETYEIHWPHSTVGACNTPNQFQSPFYDGVFCNLQSAAGVDTAKNVGVQAQIFTIVNDETYFYPDLMRGMIVDGDYGADITKYTGSTTGTSRDNTVCSSYSPITWQVDRKCHLISASSFDKMCADMKSQKDDMTHDLYPHGARALVMDILAADNQVDR